MGKTQAAMRKSGPSSTLGMGKHTENEKGMETPQMGRMAASQMVRGCLGKREILLHYAEVRGA